jgi:hypothetical protein
MSLPASMAERRLTLVRSMGTAPMLKALNAAFQRLSKK